MTHPSIQNLSICASPAGLDIYRFPKCNSMKCGAMQCNATATIRDCLPRAVGWAAIVYSCWRWGSRAGVLAGWLAGRTDGRTDRLTDWQTAWQPAGQTGRLIDWFVLYHVSCTQVCVTDSCSKRSYGVCQGNRDRETISYAELDWIMGGRTGQGRVVLMVWTLSSHWYLWWASAKRSGNKPED